jgi:uncharacterized protein YndB with AHSA1/START domain
MPCAAAKLSRMTDIRHEIETDAAPAKAYAAIATPEGIAGWWSTDSRVATEVGGEVELRFVKDDRTVVMRFRIDALEPGKRVSWTCTDNGNPVWVGTTLTWSLRPRGSGTTIAFTHGGFAEDASPPYQMTVEGWKHFVASLRAYLASGQGQPA